MITTQPDETPNHRTTRDALLYAALGDLGRLDEEIGKLPRVMHESLAPSLSAIAQAVQDGHKAISDYAKGQEPTVKAFAETELAGMRKGFAKTSEDVVAMVKKDLAEATELHRSALRQAGYREPWKPWHFIGVAWAICLAINGIYLGLYALHENGFEAGKKAGYNEAVDAKTAAAWVNTEDGKLGYRLYKAGNLRRLAECTGERWHVENGGCFGYPAGMGGGADGWYMSPKNNKD